VGHSRLGPARRSALRQDVGGRPVLAPSAHRGSPVPG
jgi:hypothetical protein